VALSSGDNFRERMRKKPHPVEVCLLGINEAIGIHNIGYTRLVDDNALFVIRPRVAWICLQKNECVSK